MALDYANAGQLPSAKPEYSRETLAQLIRSLELYFSFLDGDMPQHADRYTAKQFVGGDFYGGRFFGDGFYVNQDFQRFESFTTQNSTSVTAAYLVQLDTLDFVNNQISLVGGSRMTVALSGVYRIDYELQFSNSSGGTEIVQVWLRKNGVDLDRSNSKYALPVKVGGGINSVTMCQQAFMRELEAGDYIEVVWSPDNVSISLQTFPAQASGPPIPATASAVVLMQLLQADMPADAVLRTSHRLRGR
jgi:hypothetical protein